jgi:hypothetical protein
MAWDSKRAADLVGRTVVLRMLLPDADQPGASREMHGTIASAAEDGITVRAADGSEFTIPPELDSIVPSTDSTPLIGGKRPDFESVWTVEGLGTGEEAWTPGDVAPSPRRHSGRRRGGSRGGDGPRSRPDGGRGGARPPRHRGRRGGGHTER